MYDEMVELTEPGSPRLAGAIGFSALLQVTDSKRRSRHNANLIPTQLPVPVSPLAQLGVLIYSNFKAKVCISDEDYYHFFRLL